MLDRIVLCVDDEAILLLAVKHALRTRLGEGYRFETALDAQSALSLIDECILAGHTIEAVVSDWLMPGMRGDEFLRKVRERYPAICLILLTGYADRSAVQILERDIGLAAIFQKPCSMAALAGVIKASTIAQKY